MAKKSVIAGEYIIDIEENGHVDVLRIFSNAYATMTRIAKSKNFFIDPKWNTRQLGNHLIKEFGDGKIAKFDDIIIKRLPNDSIEVFQETNTGETKDTLREIAKKIGFEYDANWNTQTLGAKVTQYLIEHQKEADKTLKTRNVRRPKSEDGGEKKGKYSYTVSVYGRTYEIGYEPIDAPDAYDLSDLPYMDSEGLYFGASTVEVKDAEDNIVFKAELADNIGWGGEDEEEDSLVIVPEQFFDKNKLKKYFPGKEVPEFKEEERLPAGYYCMYVQWGDESFDAKLELDKEFDPSLLKFFMSSKWDNDGENNCWFESDPNSFAININNMYYNGDQLEFELYGGDGDRKYFVMSYEKDKYGTGFWEEIEEINPWELDE